MCGVCVGMSVVSIITIGVRSCSSLLLWVEVYVVNSSFVVNTRHNPAHDQDPIAEVAQNSEDLEIGVCNLARGQVVKSVCVLWHEHESYPGGKDHQLRHHTKHEVLPEL